MKKLLLLLLIPILLCSCKESEQIDEIAFVKIIAVDKAENGFRVTAGIQQPKPKEGEMDKSKDCISVECETLSQGFNMLESATDKKVFILVNTGQGESRIKAVMEKHEEMLSAGMNPAKVVGIDARIKNAASTH